jgi:hypothetical protein
VTAFGERHDVCTDRAGAARASALITPMREPAPSARLQESDLHNVVKLRPPAYRDGSAEGSDDMSNARQGATRFLRGGVGIMAAASALFAWPVAANEIGGNYAWQYRSPAETAVRAQQLDMLMRRRAGGYNSYYYQNTYVAGDLVNCSVSANATGNAGTTSATGASSSPSIGNTPSIFAQATGSSVASQGFPSAGGGTLSSPLNSNQTNTSSPQSAAVSGTTSSVGVNGLQAQGGQLQQALNSTQSNAASPQTASIVGSTACGQAGSVR